ncbi:MAG: ADP-heptose:LPS heptosyltransferase [Lentimonas sp.]
MKILIVRFSSIGDIILTTPVVRCLKEQIPNVSIHYLTKKKFTNLIQDNPNVDKVWGIEKSIKEVIEELKKENYNQIIDLHKNVRTKYLKIRLGVKSNSFMKLNLQKWWLVKTKRNLLPEKHIVERYLDAVAHLGVKNDNKPCDFYIEQRNQIDLAQHNLLPKQFVCMAMGAQFATKVLPLESMKKVIAGIDMPVVLLGGKEDVDKANDILSSKVHSNIISFCGELNLQQSASVIAQSAKILSHDTGLMHIASCFEIPIVSVWGNTVPELGMFPYTPRVKNYTINQVEGLSCRPCSKIGFQKCPKGHFDCMMKQDLVKIANQINTAD